MEQVVNTLKTISFKISLVLPLILLNVVRVLGMVINKATEILPVVDTQPLKELFSPRLMPLATALAMAVLTLNLGGTPDFQSDSNPMFSVASQHKSMCSGK